MKTVRTFKIILFALAVFPLVGIGQTSNQDNACKKLILDYVQQMEHMSAPQAKEVYHVKYRMKTRFAKQLGVSSTETSTEVYSGKNRLAIYDKKMQVFGDDTTIFVVVPEHRKIYWNDSDPRVFNDANAYKKFLAIQKALLNSATQVSCHDKDGHTLIKVIPSKDFAQKTKLVSQQITYDKKAGRIIKVDNTYNPTSKIAHQSIAYETLDFQSSKKITAPIAALFEGKELKAAYKGFEIIDNRQN